MSIHPSLKYQSGALNQHRNVLTRAERIAKLMELDKFDSSDDSPLGLVKVGSRKVAVVKKKKEKKAEDGEEATTSAE